MRLDMRMQRLRARAHWPLCSATCGRALWQGYLFPRKPLFSSFGEHTAVCGSSVRQAVARPRHRQSVCIHNIHVALVCSGPPQCAATCGKTKWPVCSGPKSLLGFKIIQHVAHIMILMLCMQKKNTPFFSMRHNFPKETSLQHIKEKIIRETIL